MRKLFSCCVVGPFVLALALAMGLFAIKYTVLSANFHKNNLRKTHFYEESLHKFPTFIGQALNQSAKQDDGPKTQESEENAQFALLLTTFAKVVEKNVTPEWLQTETEKVIDGIFGYMKGDDKAISVVIPMSPIKAALGDSFSATFKDAFNQLPTCSDAQISEARKSQSTQPAYDQCKPPGIKASDFDKALNDPKTNPFTNIPDSYDLGQNLSRNSQTLNSLRMLFRFANALFWLSIVVILLTAGLTFLVYRRHTPGAMRLLGVPSIIIGGVNLITTLLSYLATGFIGNQIEKASGFGGEFLTLVSDIITNNIKAILNYSLVASIVVLVLGIALVVTARAISRGAVAQTENKTPAPSPPPAKP